MRIDSHHHLWRYDPEEHPWISESMAVLRRDYLPEHVEPALRTAGFEGSVVVQATHTLGETEWLLDLAQSHPFIRGVVGWAPLVDPNVEATLERLAAHGRLRGVRHVLQGEADDAYMLRPDFDRGIAALDRGGLVYDVLIFPRHLTNALALVDRHPSQPFVVDHMAKPAIAGAAFDAAWAEGIRALARRPNVACKVSGLVTEVRDPAWSPALLAPYVETVLEAFGPRRLMIGSDWPVCLLRASYADWMAAASALTARLSSVESAEVWGGTACRVYGLSDR